MSAPLDTRARARGHGGPAAGASLPDPPARTISKNCPIPDFFIVGQPKAARPRCMRCCAATRRSSCPRARSRGSSRSELHERTPPRPEGTPATLAQYLALFAAARAGQRVGEASRAVPVVAHRRARDRRGGARGADRRDPARARALLRSLHLQFVQTYVETERDLRRALALERPAARRASRFPRHTYWPQALMYSEHVRYVEQLRRYHELFAREQVLVLIYDDFRADNEATVRRVLRFLEVDDTVPSSRSRPTRRCARARSACTSYCTPSPSGTARSRGR